LSESQAETKGVTGTATGTEGVKPQTGRLSERVHSLRDGTRGRVQYPAWWSESREDLVRSGEGFWAADGAYEDFIL
jgi:hypothetical protein